MKNNSQVVKLVRAYLKSGGSKLKLAGHLGYTCTTTIDQWLKRKHVPTHQAERVQKYLSKEVSK